MLAEPVWDGYFADPFLTRGDGEWVAYGTGRPEPDDGPGFDALRSPDLRSWRPVGRVFDLPPELGTDCWAPEVVARDGAWWMVYSAGRGIEGHHLRVARAATALGPFLATGTDLTPGESFAIDAHPFQDADGAWYLYFAHDVLDSERPGTHLAVATWDTPLSIGPVRPVLTPNADWQIYERDRAMYGRRFDWHTLEGPTVVRRDGRYVLLYSGGSWEGDDYGVGYALADSPLGPWRHAGDGPSVLSTASTGLPGPGHNSVVTASDGSTVTAFHAWNPERTKRQMYIAPLTWRDGAPVVELFDR